MRAPGALPTPLTTFVGRVDELRAVEEALRTTSLVTLVGPGGSGKSRLAIELGRRMPDTDVRWVDLTGTDDGAAVPSLVARSVGAVAPAEATLDAIVAQDAERPSMLVLDNCEHLIDAVAGFLDGLVGTVRNLTVLATSREPLGLAGEHVFRVPSLTLDDAVELFRSRAMQHAHADQEPTIRLACARLDGIPLAVELAAAWSSALSPQQILDGIDDRFSLLVRSPRGVAARHQTLAASMDWSHDLLDAEERALFRRLSIFGGTFTLDVVGRVCAFGTVERDAVRGLLARLVDKSLVVAHTSGAEARYRMLESVREYASARLAAAGEHDAVRRRELTESLALVRELAPLLDEDLEKWRTRLSPFAESLRSTLDYGLALPDPGEARQLAAELAMVWHQSIHGRDGIRLLRRAVELGGQERTPLQARLLVALALVADTTAPFGIEYDAAQAALEIAREVGDRRTASLALLLSAVGTFYDDLDRGHALAESARVTAAELGYRHVEYGAIALHGIIAHLRDRHDRALDLLEDATAGLRALGERGIASTALGFMAMSALATGDASRAREFAMRAVDVATPLADYHRVGAARGVLATVEGTTGNTDAAQAALQPVLATLRDGDHIPFVPGLGRVVGHLRVWAGRPAEAVHWYSGTAMGESDGSETYLSVESKVALVLALRQSGEAERARELCAEVLSASRQLGLPRIVADALEQSAALASDLVQAERLHHEALSLRLEHGLRPGVIRSLEALAGVAAASGGAEDGARLAAACERARRELGYPRLRHDDLGLPIPDGAIDGAAAMTIDEAAAYARRARGARGRPGSGWASLTPTEREVVRFAVQGLSNPEIAKRLYMSRSTVKTHLSHVYAKLGVSNRTELATAAGDLPAVGG